MEETIKLLPIGSVVKLKNGNHRLMIIGYTPFTPEGKEKMYDYFACFYPEGYSDPNLLFVFNNNMIEKIYDEGFSDDEEKSFRNKVNKIVNDIKDSTGRIKLSDEELSKYISNIVKGGKK
jgi:hypothetical protein